MNHPRALAFEARGRRFMRVVELFFSAFTTGRLDEARRACVASFAWFGRAIDRTGWSTPRALSFHEQASMTFSKLRSLPDGLVPLLRARSSDDDLFEGPVSLEVVIALVDVTVAGSVVTVGAVVEDIAGEPLIVRVFDPTALRSALENLGNSSSAPTA